MSQPGLDTSYQLDGTAGLATLVEGFYVNSITDHKLKHFKKFATIPLTKVTVPKVGNAHLQSSDEVQRLHANC